MTAWEEGHWGGNLKLSMLKLVQCRDGGLPDKRDTRLRRTSGLRLLKLGSLGMNDLLDRKKRVLAPISSNLF